MLPKKNRHTLKFLLSFLCAMVGNAGANTNTNTVPWKFEITPYLWAINMNGHAKVGPLSANVSESFSDIMKQFDGGAMLFVSADKGKFGLFFNGMYTSLSKKTGVGPFTIKSNNDFGIFSAGVSYAILQKAFANDRALSIEPYVGVRDTLNDSTIRILNTPLSASLDEQWVDPIFGGRVRANMNKAWLVIVAGDVGGTSNNDYSYNAMGLLGYKPQTRMKNSTFYIGYRYLYQNYVTGSGLNTFVWDMRLFGPVLGCSMRFHS